LKAVFDIGFHQAEERAGIDSRIKAWVFDRVAPIHLHEVEGWTLRRDTQAKEKE